MKRNFAILSRRIKSYDTVRKQNKILNDQGCTITSPVQHLNMYRLLDVLVKLKLSSVREFLKHTHLSPFSATLKQLEETVKPFQTLSLGSFP